MRRIPEIPFDIVVEITAHIDRTALQSVSLLNSSWNEEANRYIWEKISIFKKDQKLSRNAAKRAARFIERDPRRSRWIRELTIRSPSIETEERSNVNWKAVSSLIRDVLQRTVHLRSLTIDLEESVFLHLLPNLDYLRFPSLRTLEVSPHHFRCFEGFFLAHPDIESLVLHNNYTASFDVVSTHETPWLPNLKNITATIPTFAIMDELLRTRCVTHMTLIFPSSEDLDSFKRINAHLEGSTSSLTAGFALSNLFSPFLNELASFRKLIRMRFLFTASAGYESINVHAAAESLSRLPAVTLIQWNMECLPGFAECPDLYANTTLRTVEFYEVGRISSSFYRPSESRPWSRTWITNHLPT